MKKITHSRNATSHLSIKEIILSIAILSILLIPSAKSVYAMELFVSKKPDALHVGDIAMLTIGVNTDGKKINVVDGGLTLSDNVRVRTILTNGSAFTLWPQKPSVQENTITFIGGTTKGITGKNIELFTLVLDVIGAGKAEITFNNTNTYLADGSATQVVARSNTFETLIDTPNTAGRANDLARTIFADKEPPEKFLIDIGRDAQSYDGKYFATFYTIDRDSGMNRYEVIEGDLPLIRSGSTYVLQDQSLKTKLTVKAIDNAGNERVATVVPSEYKPYVDHTVRNGVIVSLIILILGYIGYSRFGGHRFITYIKHIFKKIWRKK